MGVYVSFTTVAKFPHIAYGAYCLCTSYEITYIPVFFTDCYFISNSNLDTTLCWESSITVVIVEHYKLDVLQVAVVIDSPASCSDERHWADNIPLIKSSSVH